MVMGIIVIGKLQNYIRSVYIYIYIYTYIYIYIYIYIYVYYIYYVIATLYYVISTTCSIRNPRYFVITLISTHACV